MKQLLFLLSWIALLLCSSCRDETSDLGAKWVESDLKNILTDTCTVKMSTVLLDSVNTSNNSVAQLGYYEDNVWGKISASSYVEYTPASFTPDDNITYRFDSLTVTVKCNGDYLGDTLKPVKVNLYELKENIVLNDDGYLFNNSSVAYNSTPISTISIQPRPKGGNLLEYRISDELGLTWFNKMLSKSDDFTSSSQFRLYFKGIAFVPDESANNSIIGFAVSDSSMCLTLHYHEISSSVSEDLTVKIAPTTPYFNKVKHNRTNTPLQLFDKENKTIESEKLNNISYVQGITGLYTKVEFPYLNRLLLTGQMVSIESATLYLYPVKGSYGKLIPLPSSLALYVADQNNVTGSQITDNLGTSVQTGSLTTDEPSNENTYYSFDITSFLKSNLGTVGNKVENLQLVLPTSKINTSYQSVIFGDMNHPQSKVKLSVLYKVYKTY